MKKWIFTFLAIYIVGGGIWFFTQRNSSPAAEAVSTTSTQKSTTAQGLHWYVDNPNKGNFTPPLMNSTETDALDHAEHHHEGQNLSPEKMLMSLFIHAQTGDPMMISSYISAELAKKDFPDRSIEDYKKRSEAYATKLSKNHSIKEISIPQVKTYSNQDTNTTCTVTITFTDQSITLRDIPLKTLAAGSTEWYVNITLTELVAKLEQAKGN